MEFLNDFPAWLKWLAGIAGTIAGGALFLRQYLSGAAAERASDSGQIAALQVYKDMVSELKGLLNDANTRSDQFAKERNEAIEIFGTLKGQLAEMTRQIEAQSREINELRAQMEKLYAKT